MRKFKTSKEDFLRKTYIKCPKCKYNNEKGRLNHYGTCLKCGSVLDNKKYFMIEMMKKLKDNERKMR